ncbi:MAG: DHH family phosphoesterase [Candidatus Buchananbacteria bacterium]
MSEILAQLLKVVEKIKADSKVINIIANHLDPDSIASAFALKHLLRHLGIPNARIRILYCGVPGEKQNEMIIQRFSLFQHMLPLDEFWPKINGNDVFAFVDCSNPNDGRLGAAAGKINPIIVVDHHQNPAPIETEDNFIWVETYGACSTMLTKLLNEVGLMTFKKEVGDDLFVTLLLTLGIYSDTHGLLANVTDDDSTSYFNVLSLSDKQALRNLTNIQDSRVYVETENYARNHCIIDGLRLVACAGYLPSTRKVYVAKLANMMSNWDGITVAVVFAIIDDCNLVFSIRSTDSGLQATLNDVLQRKFKNSFGLKMSDDNLRLEGGAQIHLGIDLAADEKVRDQYLELVTGYMRNIFFGNDLR